MKEQQKQQAFGKSYQIYYAPYSQSKAQLKIQEDKIKFISDKRQQVIPTEDLIGVKQRDIVNGKNTKYQLYHLIGYPKKKKFLSNVHRYIQTLAQFYLPCEDMQQNAALLENIIQKITNRTHKLKKILMYFNPNAGSNSKKHFNKAIDFLFNTNFHFELITTQRGGHCQQHLQTIDPNNYQFCVIVSGDGLIHEFVNAKVNLPLTHVPAGTGNAFCKMQTVIANQQYKDQQPLFLAIKGKQFSFNLTKYESNSMETPLYSFISLNWAVIADIDLNSEFLRFLGDTRLDLYGAFRVISMKRYRGRFYYSETVSEIPPLDVDLSGNQNFQVIQDTFLHFIVCTMAYLGSKVLFAPCLKVQQQMMDIQIIRENMGRMQLMKYLLASGSGSHFDESTQNIKQGFRFEHFKVKSYRLQPLGDQQQIGIFSIDGQRYPAEKIQGSISERKVRTFV